MKRNKRVLIQPRAALQKRFEMTGKLNDSLREIENSWKIEEERENVKPNSNHRLRKFFNQAKFQEDSAKITLIGIFLGLFTTFAFRRPAGRKKSRAFDLKPFDLGLLGLATFRLGRLIAFDRVADPLRKPFTRKIQDPTGAGVSIEPRGEGVQQALGQLLSCPICAGTWIAALLVFGLQRLPGPTRAFLAVMSATGAAELLNALAEALSWTGQAARKKAGGHTRRPFKPYPARPRLAYQAMKTNGGARLQRAPVAIHSGEFLADYPRAVPGQGGAPHIGGK